LTGIHEFDTAPVDDAGEIGEPDMLARHAQIDQQFDASERCGAGAAHHEFDLRNLLADDSQAIEKRGRGDDSRAVLIIVKHRNFHALTQLALDDEALRRLDILEIDRAERRLQRGDDFHELVGIALLDFDVEHVDAGKFLEKYRFAFHDRLAGQWANRA
jgi:hypothetical protein